MGFEVLGAPNPFLELRSAFFGLSVLAPSLTRSSRGAVASRRLIVGAKKDKQVLEIAPVGVEPPTSRMLNECSTV